MIGDGVHSFSEWQNLDSNLFTMSQSLIISCRLLLKYGKLDLFPVKFKELSNYELSQRENLISERLWILYLFEAGETSSAIQMHEGLDPLSNIITDLDPEFEEKYALFSHTTIMILNHYVMAQYLEYQSQYQEAIDLYNKIVNDQIIFSLKIYELGQIYYHLGRLLKYTGKLNESISVFKLAISSIPNDYSSKMANSTNFLGELYLIAGKFSTSASYLDNVLEQWNILDDPIGRSWALYNLGILHMITEDFEKGLSYLEQLYELTPSSLNSVYIAEELFYLVIFSIEANKPKKMKHYLDQLEIQAEYGNPLIKRRFHIAKQYASIADNKNSEVITNPDEISTLLETASPIIDTLVLTVMYLQLLVLELEIMEEGIEKQSLNKQIEQVWNRFKLSIFNPVSLSFFTYGKKLLDYLERLQTHSQRLETKIKALDNINQNLHSIPRLKVLIALHMRINLSFSELVNLSNLSRGSVFNICEQLANQDLVTISKEIKENRFVTIYSLTPHGVEQLREYSEYFQILLKEFF